MHQFKLTIFTEIVDGVPVYDVDTSNIPTAFLPQFVHAATYDALARAGIKYDQTKLEREFGIRIDYFRALNQAVEAGKKLIEVDFVDERQKNWHVYQDHCKVTGLDPKQIFIDFPTSK